MTRDALYALLAHPMTREAMKRVGRGDDPALVAAEMAGVEVTKRIATALGAAKPVSRPSVNPNVVEAEYTVIDVTPNKGKKKAG